MGFAPWIVYWVLVGNVPFETAVLVALAVAVASFVIGRVKGTPGRTLEIGAIGTFVVLAVLTFTVSQSFMEQWMQPLSNAGIFVVALTSVLIGRPFVREFAEVDQPEEVVKSDVFKRITTLLTWIWVAAFAGMTVSSAIPPIVYGDATILDTKTPLSFVCYWVIPFTLLGLAALASRVLPEKMAPGDDEVRKTSFVCVRRSGDRPTDLPRHRTRQPRSRRGQGGLRRPDREQGNPALGGRDPRIMACDIQGPRKTALVD